MYSQLVAVLNFIAFVHLIEQVLTPGLASQKFVEHECFATCITVLFGNFYAKMILFGGNQNSCWKLSSQIKFKYKKWSAFKSSGPHK